MNFNWLFGLHCIYPWLKIHLGFPLSFGLKPWYPVKIFLHCFQLRNSCLHAVDQGLEILCRSVICDSYSYEEPYKFDEVMPSRSFLWHRSTRGSLQTGSSAPCRPPGQHAPPIGGSGAAAGATCDRGPCRRDLCSVTQRLSSAHLPQPPRGPPAAPCWAYMGRRRLPDMNAQGYRARWV